MLLIRSKYEVALPEWVWGPKKDSANRRAHGLSLADGIAALPEAQGKGYQARVNRVLREAMLQEMWSTTKA